MSYQVLPPHTPAELTVSIEQGVLLGANPLARFVLESTIARALALHPIDICAFVVEGTHIHFLIYVTNPEDVPGFVGRLKTESAHYINSFLDRQKRTVWCEGYFCAPILTQSSVEKKLTYIYTNPAKDNLETSIENYPGLTSWRAFSTGRCSKTCPRLHRPMIPYLPGKLYKQHTYRRIIKDLKARATSFHPLEVKPNAWMKYFGITEPDDIERVNQRVRQSISLQEQLYAEQREQEGKTVIGREQLIAQHMETEYMPEREGKKMWCICDDKELRIEYIKWAKEIKRQAMAVYKRWKQGDFSVKYPPGVFAPAMPRMANMTPLACCY